MMVEVNHQHECARQSIMRAETGTPGGTIGIPMALGVAGGIVGVMNVGVEEESIVRKTERRRGIMIGRDMRILSRRSLEWM